MMNKSGTEFSDQQLLQAFRYVAGEFSPDESEAFEELMLEDQAFVEAVVRATSLSRLVASSAAPAPLKVRPVDAMPIELARRGHSYLVTGISACLCLLMLVAVYKQDAGSNVEVAESFPQDNAELLVSVWANEAHENLDSGLEESDVLSDELDVPDWLLAAVTISGEDDFDDEDMEL